MKFDPPHLLSQMKKVVPMSEIQTYDPSRLLGLHALAGATRAHLRSISDRRDELRERRNHWQRQARRLGVDFNPRSDVGKAIEEAEAKIAELLAAMQEIDREASEIGEIMAARASNFSAALERAKVLGLEIPLELDSGGSGLTAVPHIYEEAGQ